MFKLLFGLLHHTYLILTFRHNGQGLNSWRVFGILALLSFAAGVFRWTEVPGQITPTQSILFLCFLYMGLIGMFKPPLALATGYALLSISWDLVVVATAHFTTTQTANMVGHAEAIFLGVLIVKATDAYKGESK